MRSRPPALAAGVITALLISLVLVLTSPAPPPPGSGTPPHALNARGLRGKRTDRRCLGQLERGLAKSSPPSNVPPPSAAHPVFFLCPPAGDPAGDAVVAALHAYAASHRGGDELSFIPSLPPVGWAKRLADAVGGNPCGADRMAPGPYSALERSIERDALSVGKHYTVPGFCSADELSHAEQRRLALAAGHLSWHDLSAVLRAKHLDPQKHPSNFSCIVFLHDPVHAFLASYRRHTPFVVPGGAPVPLRNLSLPHLRALLDERLPPSDLLRLAESLLPALPDAPAPHPHARGLPTLRAAQRRLAARFRLPRTLGRTMTGVAEAHPWIPPASKRQPGRPDICRAALNLGHCVALDPRDPGFAAAWGKYVPWAPVPVVPAEPPEGSLDPARGKAVREALADEIALHGYARRRYQMLVAEGH